MTVQKRIDSLVVCVDIVGHRLETGFALEAVAPGLAQVVVDGFLRQTGVRCRAVPERLDEVVDAVVQLIVGNSFVDEV